MYGLTDAKSMTFASAETRSSLISFMKSLCGSIVSLCILQVLLSASLPSGASATVNVFSKDPKMQDQFLADTTTQWNATVVQTPYFPANKNVTLIDRKSISTVPTPTVSLSSDTFTNAYGLGMYQERTRDLEIIQGLQDGCTIQACTDNMGEAYDSIFLQN